MDNELEKRIERVFDSFLENLSQLDSKFQESFHQKYTEKFCCECGNLHPKDYRCTCMRDD